MNKKPLLIGGGIVAVIVIALIAFFVYQSMTPRTDLIQVNAVQEEITCPLETKMCPDGQIVIRDSTNDCEFYSCPVDATNTSTLPADGSGTACTQEAKMCPDGTYVGRETARDCAFKPCADGTQL